MKSFHDFFNESKGSIFKRDVSQNLEGIYDLLNQIKAGVSSLNDEEIVSIIKQLTKVRNNAVTHIQWD